MVLCKTADQEVTSIPKLGQNFTDLDSQGIFTPPSEVGALIKIYLPE